MHQRQAPDQATEAQIRAMFKYPEFSAKRAAAREEMLKQMDQYQNAARKELRKELEARRINPGDRIGGSILQSPDGIDRDKK